MSSRPDRDPFLSWLDDGPLTLPNETRQAIAVGIRTMPRRRAVSGRTGMPRLVAAFATVAAVVVLAAVALRIYAGDPLPDVGVPGLTPSTRSASPTASVPAEQMSIIARHADAVNNRDAEAFVDVFAADGAFDPRGTFDASSSLFSDSQPIADRSLVDAFMEIQEAWGFEAEVVACDELSRSEFIRLYGQHQDGIDMTVHCAVKSRWQALALEVSESWYYEFNGTQLMWWGQTVRDATPAGREMALGMDGLLEWEVWLESRDPDAAARLLNPRVYPVTVPCGDGVVFADEIHTTTAPPLPPCEWSSDNVDVEQITSGERYGRGQDGWVIGGESFVPFALVPYDPAKAADIAASIREFLNEQGGR